MMGSKAYESPLIPHVRMRALYRALVETRVLSEGLSKAVSVPRNLEAAYVATAIDLRAGDLVTAYTRTWLTAHIRAVGARPTAGAPAAGELSSAKLAGSERFALKTRNGLDAASAIDQLMSAAGVAHAVHAAAAGVAVTFVGRSAIGAAEWKRFLAIAFAGSLPLIVVAIPDSPSKEPVDIADIAKRLKIANVPVIPVDAGDAIALYRVAQESIVRARADAQPAIIDCVPCKTDPVALLGRQLVARRICTQHWIDGVEPAIRQRLG